MRMLPLLVSLVTVATTVRNGRVDPGGTDPLVLVTPG